MWSLTAEDIRSARTKILERRRSLEKAMKGVDEEISELERIEQSIEAFHAKYISSSSPAVNQEAAAGNSGSTNGADVQAAASAPQESGAGNWGGVPLRPAAPEMNSRERYLFAKAAFRSS
jgi:hypothetical protein